MSVQWRIELTSTAETLLRGIKDRRVQGQLLRRIERLADSPETQGKPLIGDLFGYYSVRAVKERYRILFKLRDDLVIVYVVAVGIRKEGDRNDIYRLAQRLFRQGLLAPETTDESRED